MVRKKYYADPELRAKKREWDTKYRKKKRRDTEYTNKIRENARIRYRLKHNSKPIPEKVYAKTHGRRGHSADFDALPLIPYMNAWLDEHPMVTSHGEIIRSIAYLSKQAGVGDKRLRNILEGKETTIYMSDADKVCVAIGTTLDWVYSSENRPTTDLCA